MGDSTLRLDHIPIAVRDLDAARQTYHDRLGFSIKPGRLHPNSIENAHIKFPDGSALELITATSLGDETAAGYVEFLEAGDGGAHVSLAAGPVDSLSNRLRGIEPRHGIVRGAWFEWLVFPREHPLHYLFFGRVSSRPVDLPEHHAHANTATRLAAVWIARPDLAREQRLLRSLGARSCASDVRLPIGVVHGRWRLGRGEVYLIHLPNASVDRPIAGATIEVRHLDSALAAIDVPSAVIDVGSDSRGRFARIPPSHAHGLWIELLESGAPVAAPDPPSELLQRRVHGVRQQ